MLEELFYFHQKITEYIPLHFKRYLFEEVNWSLHAICLTGARGVGKTTLLLQYYHQQYNDVEKCLYVSADNVVVATKGLLNVATEYFKYGGEALIIDEIHKYPLWQVELKNILDIFKKKQILISGSSALELKMGKTDLSRRVVYYSLKGLSFREYLMLAENQPHAALTLAEILERHIPLAQKISVTSPILKHFRNYLAQGYYPFFLEGEAVYFTKLINVIEKILYEDVSAVSNIKQSNVIVLKKILWLIATSCPFYANIEQMSRELGISKPYVYVYLEYLENAELIYGLRSRKKGYKLVRKPEKLFLENTNLLFALNNNLKTESELGTVRETFFVNQVKKETGLTLSDQGDFATQDQFIFEVGGKNKDFSQIKNLKNAYVAADNIEIGYGNKVPLYLFGFLY